MSDSLFVWKFILWKLNFEFCWASRRRTRPIGHHLLGFLLMKHRFIMDSIKTQGQFGEPCSAIWRRAVNFAWDLWEKCQDSLFELCGINCLTVSSEGFPLPCLPGLSGFDFDHPESCWKLYKWVIQKKQNQSRANEFNVQPLEPTVCQWRCRSAETSQVSEQTSGRTNGKVCFWRAREREPDCWWGLKRNSLHRKQ